MNVKNNRMDRCAEILFLCTIFALYFIWAVILPFNEGPDEYMRYEVPKYIYKYGRLPIGSDPEIRDPMWGISYAYYPMLSYIVSGLLMKLVGIFNSSEAVLLAAARMASVLFSTGTGFFCLKIGKRFFSGIYVWVFAILVTFLPQFTFISSYTSCEALSVFSVAWLTYAFILGKERKWDIKSTIFLGLGMGICVLSYYNAYGILLASILYAVVSVLIDKETEKKGRKIWSRVGIVFLVVVAVTGWWFVRNYIIYDGDILGMMTSSQNAELYAVEALKPSNRSTPSNMGYSLFYMFFDMGWIKTSIVSFIAAFGSFSVWPAEEIYDIYYVIGIIGFVAAILIRRKKEKSKPADLLFTITMIYMCIITFSISIYYSYFNDYQPQGRYFMANIIALSYFVTSGWQKLSDRMPAVVGKVLGSAIVITVIFINLSIIVNTLIPYWY